MSDKLTKRTLEKKLARKTKAELVKEIGMLYSKFTVVKQHYQVEFGSTADKAAILQDYKKKMRGQYFTPKGYKNPKASLIRKLISEYKKVATPKDLIDLMLYRVECAVEFTNDLGDIDENFYVSTEGCFYDAAKLMAKEGLKSEFKNRCLAIVKDTDGIGWGFHDELADIYEKLYGEVY